MRRRRRRGNRSESKREPIVSRRCWSAVEREKQRINMGPTRWNGERARWWWRWLRNKFNGLTKMSKWTACWMGNEKKVKKKERKGRKKKEREKRSSKQTTKWQRLTWIEMTILLCVRMILLIRPAIIRRTVGRSKRRRIFWSCPDPNNNEREVVWTGVASSLEWSSDPGEPKKWTSKQSAANDSHQARWLSVGLDALRTCHNWFDAARMNV